MRTQAQPPTAALLSLATLFLLALPACATRAIGERCGLVAADAATPSLPPDFAELDSLLVQRATSMTSTARGLKRSLLVLYQRDFLERVLPALCDLVEEARAHAARGNTSEAGTRYQALLVAAQVMQLELALAQMAGLADAAGQPSASIVAILEGFDRDLTPLIEAALSLDRSRLAAAMPEGARRYNTWLGRLDEWGLAIERNARLTRTALLVADVLMIAFTAYDAAAIAARGGTAPPPPLAGIAGSGVAVALRADTATIARAIEAIRKLIASGALDPAVVAGLSIMNAGARGGTGATSIQGPTAMQMASQRPVPPKVRKVNGRLPINSEWAGQTYPLKNLPEGLRKKYPNSVSFTEDGFPDFSPYAQKTVHVNGLTGARGPDSTLANKAAGLESTPSGYTWHHHQDGMRMQLVPSDLHEAVRHTGGAALVNCK